MATSRLTKPYHRLVMQLNAVRPMDKAELKRDRAYAAFIVTCFLVLPLIFLPMTFAFEHGAWGAVIGILAPIVGAVVGLLTRRRILGDFFQVMDVDAHLRVSPVTDRKTLLDLAERGTLAFSDMADESGRLFLFNWLCNRQALDPAGITQAYRISGQDLVRLLAADIEGDMDLLLIPVDAGRLSEGARERLEFELPFVKGAWLANLVRLVQETSARQERQRRATLGQLRENSLSNKGQRLG